MRILGLDPGTARLGVAISDATGGMALPLEIIQRDDRGEDLRRVARIVTERGVEQIVVGLPLMLSGERGPAAEQMDKFISALETTVGVEVVTWDERLSTAQVDKALHLAGVSSRERRGRTDAAAAAVILQSYLDAHER
ncbi:MAG TPA: Holliday junction resolvase RuvX [Armatimonadota bacterium]|jgi:putative Holliday junction resolvase